MKKVVIIGAGFSGLSLAYYLRKSGVEVDIYDSKSRVGGLLATHQTPHGLAETAANGILFTSRLGDFCDQLGLEILAPLAESKKRFIFRNKPKQWPLNFTETIRLIFPLLLKLIFSKKSLAPKSNESVQQWGERELGAGATQFLLDPALKGVYAGQISKMSASLILGRFFKRKPSTIGDAPSLKTNINIKNTKKIKGTISFNGGMQELISTLETKLKEMGVHFYLGQSRKPSSDVITVVATSAWDAAEYFKDCKIFEKVQNILCQIESVPILTGTYFFKEKQTRYPGFGCLFPSESKAPTRALGVLMNSYIFKGRNNYYNETWIMGGAADPSIMDLPENEICDHIIESRKKIFSDTAALLGCKITKWSRALPHYTVKHENLLKELEQSNSDLLSYGVILHGNYLGGIGLSQILDRSYSLSKEISTGKAINKK